MNPSSDFKVIPLDQFVVGDWMGIPDRWYSYVIAGKWGEWLLVEHWKKGMYDGEHRIPVMAGSYAHKVVDPELIAMLTLMRMNRSPS